MNRWGTDGDHAEPVRIPSVRCTSGVIRDIRCVKGGKRMQLGLKAVQGVVIFPINGRRIRGGQVALHYTTGDVRLQVGKVSAKLGSICNIPF